MTQNLTTIEDLLEIAAGLKNNSKIQLESSDVTIMHSIARQVFKGTALTDRQYILMQEKLTKYRDQFTALDYKFDQAVSALRQPLREIDRSKYIRIVDDFNGHNYARDKDLGIKHTWMVVKFPFSKSLILSVTNATKDTSTYHHSKGSHEHFFVLNEINVMNVVSEFKDKNFDIEQSILDYYHSIVEINQSPENYIPGIFNGTLKNISDESKRQIDADLGELTKENLLIYIDRKRRYGIEIVNPMPNIIDLTSEIALRNKTEYLSKPSNQRFESLIESIYTLDRFPLLVVIDEKEAEVQLDQTFTCLKNIVPVEEQSVLFRLSSDDNSFNEYVKDKKLNNWVDKNTKVVYINNNKLPKLVINGDWKPIAALAFGSQINRFIDCFIKNYCDLIIFRDEMISPMRKYSRFYV